MKYKLCPKCKVQLHWALANPKDPWDDERYICPKCDGTKRQPKGYKYAQSTMRTPTHKRAMRVNKRAARRWKLDED